MVAEPRLLAFGKASSLRRLTAAAARPRDLRPDPGLRDGAPVVARGRCRSWTMVQARAVSDAAQAAAQATEAAQAVMASAHEARRIEALSRFFQKPDMYKPDTREQEIDQWTDWRHMDTVEARTNEEANLNATTHPDAARRSRELYAILASFIRNRPLKILRNVAGSNGYEAWRQLMLEMQPKTRQKQLALMTQLNNMTFDPKRSLNEQLGKFDEVVREYERISGTTYPDDLRVSTLVSAAPGPLQVQLHMALTPTTTYNELKEKVLAYERSTTKWHASSGLQFPAVTATTDTSGPMEIDVVTHGGGKKGGGKKGIKKGHYMRDCWYNQPGGGVHQVQEETGAPSTPSSSASTVAHPQQTPVTPAAKAARRIKLSTPPTAPHMEIFDISEDTVTDFALEPAAPYFVQMVTAAAVEREGEEDTLIILDSGADASMVPYSFGARGTPAEGSPPVLQDAQGNRIHGGTHRKFDYWFAAGDGRRFAVREQCVVGNVQVPLLAIGKLLRRGWQVINDGEVKLQDPFGRHTVCLTGGAGMMLKCLTTLVRKVSGTWIQIENSADSNYEALPFGPIANRGCKCITLFRMESFGEGFFGGRDMAPKASTRFATDPADDDMDFLGAAAGEAHSRERGAAEAEDPEGDYLEELAAGHAAKEAKKVLERVPVPVAAPAEVPSKTEARSSLGCRANHRLDRGLGVRLQDDLVLVVEGQRVDGHQVAGVLGQLVVDRPALGVHRGKGEVDLDDRGPVGLLASAVAVSSGTGFQKMPGGCDIRLWSQQHAAFLHNRFHVCPHMQLTPYEAAFGGKPYAGKLCIFGETVYGKMVTPYKGGAQWIAAAWAGPNPTNGTHNILTDKVAVAFPTVAAPPERDDDEHGPSSDEEANAVEKAAKEIAEKAGSDTSEEMIKGDGPPPSPKRRPGGGEGGRSEPSQGSKRKAEEDLSNDPADVEPQTGTKRIFEEVQGEAQTSTKRTQEKAQGKAQTGTKRTQEEAALGEEGNPTSIRMVETVDAEWYTASLASNEQDPEMPEEYDDMAEVEEIERLIGKQQGARQYRWANDMDAEDTFSPASIGSLLRHMAVLSQAWGTPLWVCDVKDAYLNVEQPADAAVVVDAPLSYVQRYGPKRWKLGRIPPGQRRGAQEWFVHLNVDLEKQGLEAMIEVPTLYRAKSPEERKAAQVHVDDAMMTGDVEVVNPLLDSLGKVYTIKMNGPFYPRNEFEFLKRRFRIEADGSITVRAAAHFYIDIFNLLGQPRLRQTPGPVGDLFMVDDSEQLGPGEATLFRTVVGKLLYIAGERPDLQVVIQFLASRAAAPTEGALRVLKHLAGFMKATEGHGVNLKAAKRASIMNFDANVPYGKHLVEAVSDSNFATDRNTRKSLSSGHVYIDKCLMFSFVRSPKVVVKHLQTSSLWIQQWVHKKMLKVAAIGTSKNPTDMGTKILSASRLRMLSGIAGMVNDEGEHLGGDELTEELRKTSGLNTRTLKMVQLLLATSLQGCSPTDGGTVVFFLAELFGENPAAAIMMFLLAAFLAAMVGKCLASVRWHVSIHIGQGSDQGLGPVKV
ncbi:RE1 [Symbiodinium sp. CCMP2592]|nr:RE1 [Symbiodinium sp. CCMP2592]